jgi:hypothetical protein
MNVNWTNVIIVFVVTQAFFWLGRLVGKANERYWKEAFDKLFYAVTHALFDEPVLPGINMTDQEKGVIRQFTLKIAYAMKEALDELSK